MKEAERLVLRESERIRESFLERMAEASRMVMEVADELSAAADHVASLGHHAEACRDISDLILRFASIGSTVEYLAFLQLAHVQKDPQLAQAALANNAADTVLALRKMQEAPDEAQEV